MGSVVDPSTVRIGQAMTDVARKALLCIAVMLLVGIGAALAGDHEREKKDRRKRLDHDVARAALLRGEISPLETVMTEVRKTVPGEFVGVELGRRRNVWIYTFKLISPSGAFNKITADARTGQVVRTADEDDD
jgi:uncharacterized membrane protein YkoI